MRRIIEETISRHLTDTSKYLELLESLKNPYDMSEWSIEDEVAKIKASMPVSGETDETASMQVTSSITRCITI